MRSHAAKYAVCVVLACTAAVALAISLLVLAGPVTKSARAQMATPEATLVGAGDIASCSYNRDYHTAKVVDSTITNANAPVTIFTLGDNAYPDGTANQFKNCYDPTWGGSSLGARADITLKVVNPNMFAFTRPALGNHEYRTEGASAYFNYFNRPPAPPIRRGLPARATTATTSPTTTRGAGTWWS